MTVVVESAAIQRDGSTYAQTYVYTAGNDENVRDANHALELVHSLAFEDGVWIEGTPPEGSTPIFRVYIVVSNTRRGRSRYHCAYQRLAFGAPYNPPAEAMMDVYKELKHAFRKASTK